MTTACCLFSSVDSEPTKARQTSASVSHLSSCARIALESKDVSTGQGRLKELRKKHINIKKKGLSAMDNIRALDHMFLTALGWGLERFTPAVRLKVGEPISLVPESAADRPMIVLLPDELKTGIQSSHYLWEIGLRGCTGRDPNHRDWNDLKRSCEKAGLWGAPRLRESVQRPAALPQLRASWF